MRTRLAIAAGAVLLVATGIGTAAFLGAPPPAPDPKAGAAIYAAQCAACHGGELEGAANWQRPDPATGVLPPPPLDATGHAWMHSDDELLRMVKESAPLDPPPGYMSQMPRFAGKLEDDDIRAILAFVKTRWPVSLRAYQAMQNPDQAGLPEGEIDWTFPANCGFEPIRLSPQSVRKSSG